mmetsp:Transcript_18382/g.23916  ORF Transcript_18382/g.23916 Transcript_18382/m.23916 type:complete len:638 (-) Transcript_18382:305-2218(-)
MRIQRGTLTQKGTDSPYRNRTIAENLNLFEKMQSELNDGDAVLRAKLDMSSPNLNLRDPALYRIKNLHHQRTGSTWSIYPMYDYAHAISDAIEGITHSLCTLEFENHRPLYDWVVDQYIKYATITNKPKQIEFSRLNLQHTITSKRKLASLVNAQYVQGWDDPRMPTIRGLRTRGIPPAAIRLFCQRIGISKVDTRLEPSILDDCVRAILDDVPDLPRAFAVIEPLEIIFSEEIHQQIHVSQDRILEFCSGINEKYYIERADFWDTQTQGEIPKDWKRFSDDQGSLVRLRYAYVIECLKVDRDPETNEPIRIHCQIDPETFAGKPTTKRSKKKQPGIIHWLRETDAVQIPLIHYDRLFLNPDPTELDEPNPNSMIRYNQALVEKRAVDILNNGEPFQFERQGYYVFNNIEFRRIVSLRDNFSTKLSITPKDNPNMEQAPTGKKNHDAPKRRSGGKNKYVDPDRNYRSGNFDFGHGPGTQTYLEPEVIEASRIDLRAGLILQNWTVNIGGDQSISIKTKSLPAPPIGTNVVVFMNAPNGPQILYTQHCQKDILIQPPPETEPGTRLLIHGCSADSPPSELSDVSSLISNLVLRSGRLYFRFRPLGTEDGNRPCVLPSILNDDQTLQSTLLDVLTTSSS